MGKIKCKACVNLDGKHCKIKKTNVMPKKHRRCDLYEYDASKKVPTTRVGYLDYENARKHLKAERRALREAMRKGPGRGTARDLGLVTQEKSRIIKPGDHNFSIPTNEKYPLTGDLSRFTTAATDNKE